MKRANETVHPPVHDRRLVTTPNRPNTIWTFIPSPVFPEMNARRQPRLASTADRTGSAMLQASLPSGHPEPTDPAFQAYAPLLLPRSTADGASRTSVHRVLNTATPRTSAPLPLQPAVASFGGAQGHHDVFQNQALCDRAMARINEGVEAWHRAAASLEGQQRSDFLIASLFTSAVNFGSYGYWHGAVQRTIAELGIDVMLAQKWPYDMSWIHVLAHTKHIKWLNRALAGDVEKKSLVLKDKGGRSPLFIAAASGNKSTVRCILACDDDAGTLRMQPSDSGHIALHAAYSGNHASVARLLLDRKGKEQRLFATAEGKLPIHVALQFDENIDVLQCLLAECALEQALAQTKRGSSALMLAAAAASLPAVELLLAVPGSLPGQLQARDSKGRGAIDHARHSGNTEVIARIEAAMQTLHPVSSTFATRPAIDPGAHPGPVPLTPNPAGTDVADEFSLSDYEEILFKQ
jgi:hypothetical protein